MPGGEGGTNNDQGAGSNNRKFGGAPFVPFRGVAPNLAGLTGGAGKSIGRGANNSDVASLNKKTKYSTCLLYTSPSPRDLSTSRMPSSA